MELETVSTALKREITLLHEALNPKPENDWKKRSIEIQKCLKALEEQRTHDLQGMTPQQRAEYDLAQADAVIEDLKRQGYWKTEPQH